MPSGAGVRGGHQAQEILRRFAKSKAEKPSEQDNEDDTQGRRAFTRELKLAGIQYSELCIPKEERKAGQQISLYLAAQDLGISSFMLRRWREKRQEMLHQRFKSYRNVNPKQL